MILRTGLVRICPMDKIVVQDFYSGTKPDCSPCCRPGRVLLQVLSQFAPKSPVRWSVHWISTGQHQGAHIADTILGGRSPMRSNLGALSASSGRPETGFGEVIWIGNGESACGSSIGPTIAAHEPFACLMP